MGAKAHLFSGAAVQEESFKRLWALHGPREVAYMDPQVRGCVVSDVVRRIVCKPTYTLTIGCDIGTHLMSQTTS
jgi:hypothetical protein